MKLLISAILFFTFIFAQNPDPNLILENLKEKYSEVQDYTADILIDVDINLIKIPNSKGEVFFKRPDKFKFNSEGFGLLPKQFGNINPELLLQDDHTALFMKEETIEDKEVNVIRIIPTSDSTDLILSTLWIEKENYFIRKIESNTKSGGNIKIKISYNDEIKYPLPITIELELNGGKREKEAEQNPTFRSSKSLYGNVLIKYSNYRINEGLDDEIFKEK